MTSPLLALHGIVKKFPGIRALDGVDLTVRAGEVVGLIGENGAGKSTLIKIIGGIYAPDEGELLVDGQPTRFQHVRDSMAAGFSLIHQELNLADSLSVAENIFLGKQPYRGGCWFQVTNRGEMGRIARGLLKEVGLERSPWALVSDLSVGQQQLVEIAKALAANSRLIVLDEPTSSLSLAEAKRLLALVKQLRNSGVGIIYITHRLAEVKELADRVVVLRDGGPAGELTGTDIEHNRMVSLMVGRDIQQYYQRKEHSVAMDDALVVENVTFPAATQPFNFSIRGGEIVGFAGLVGAGRTELARALFGIDPISAGTIRIAGQLLRPGSPRRAIESGMLLVPEDRKTQGLLLTNTVERNLSLAALPQLGRGGLLDRKEERALAARQMTALGVRAAGLDQQVGFLSGGNQQKVVLGKWLALNPTVLILDEPTRGVDVGAKSEIYKLMFDLAERGVGILMISSEMEEVISVSDRVIVIHEGAIRGELQGEHMTEENILSIAIGQRETI